MKKIIALCLLHAITILQADDETEMLRAAMNENWSKVKELLGKGTSVNAQPQGYGDATVLWTAANRGNMEMVRDLVEEYGADVNVRESYNETPLMAAVHHPLIIDYLLSVGANPNIKNKRDETVLYKFVKDIAEQIQWYPDDQQTQKALAKTGLTVVKNLIAHNADADRANKDNRLLNEVIRENLQNMFDFLLSKITNFDAKDSNGATSLMSAVIRQNIHFVKELINKGANVNAAADTGQTPLMMAVRRKNFDITKELLKAGANPHASNDQGETPYSIVNAWLIKAAPGSSDALKAQQFQDMLSDVELAKVTQKMKIKSFSEGSSSTQASKQ